MQKPPGKPTISIIVPTFQEGQYIANTILNLREAANPSSVEVIVVDLSLIHI